jgi:citrate lyase beta subunit
MNAKVRRSWLLAPLSKEERVLQAARSGADVLELDLVELVRAEDKPAARQRVASAIETVKAAGTAAVPFAGRMIDVPVDEWAKVVLELADACAARDTEKQVALERLAGG